MEGSGVKARNRLFPLMKGESSTPIVLIVIGMGCLNSFECNIGGYSSLAGVILTLRGLGFEAICASHEHTKFRIRRIVINSLNFI
jgi:hypothetical protein